METSQNFLQEFRNFVLEIYQTYSLRRTICAKYLTLFCHVNDSSATHHSSFKFT